MAANGKGNGKKEGTAAASEPPPTESKAPNGKAAHASPGVASEPPPAEEAAGSEAAAPPEAEASHDDPPAEAEAAPATESVTDAPSEETAKAEHPPKEYATRRGEAWGVPLARFDRAWTQLESRLLTFVLVWQILSLVAWVFLSGLSESVTTAAGAVFRAVLLSVALGLGAWSGTRRLAEARRRDATLVAVAAGVALVLLWRRTASADAGAAHALDVAVVKYFNNVKGWLQEGSTLTLLGGLRGLGTRLTLWLALLGGSLATASGKHIHVDVVFRFIPAKARVPVAVINYFFAAAVCFAGVWGFFDHIAIEAYGSRADDRAGVKIENALHHIGNHAFFTRKQLGLDLRSLPHVLKGEPYGDWMTADAWNAWVDDAGFEARFPANQVKTLRIPEGTHPPFVVSPDGETLRSALVHTLGLVFPFGLLAIGLRFLLRALLTESGHYSPDPDEAHKEEIGAGATGGAQ